MKRPITDYVVLIFVLLIALSYMTAVITVSLVTVTDPDRDVSTITDVLLSILIGMVNTLIGFFAGSAYVRSRNGRHE